MISTESISVPLVRWLCYFISFYSSLGCNILLWILLHGYLSICMLTVWNRHRIYDIYLFSIIPWFFSLIWKYFSKYFPPFLIILYFFLNFLNKTVIILNQLAMNFKVFNNIKCTKILFISTINLDYALLLLLQAVKKIKWYHSTCSLMRCYFFFFYKW
jgi:hypothetical protein